MLLNAVICVPIGDEVKQHQAPNQPPFLTMVNESPRDQSFLLHRSSLPNRQIQRHNSADHEGDLTGSHASHGFIDRGGRRCDNVYQGDNSVERETNSEHLFRLASNTTSNPTIDAAIRKSVSQRMTLLDKTVVPKQLSSTFIVASFIFISASHLGGGPVVPGTLIHSLSSIIHYQ